MFDSRTQTVNFGHVSFKNNRTRVDLKVSQQMNGYYFFLLKQTLPIDTSVIDLRKSFGCEVGILAATDSVWIEHGNDFKLLKEVNLTLMIDRTHLNGLDESEYEVCLIHWNGDEPELLDIDGNKVHCEGNDIVKFSVKNFSG